MLGLRIPAEHGKHDKKANDVGECHVPTGAHPGNRILPLGWRKSGPDIKKFHGKPLEETWPDLVGDDPYYADPLGAEGKSVVRYSVALPAGTKFENVTVSAQLYYQAIPPYYLLQRFEQAPNGEGTQRLYYMTSTLDTTKTPFPGWKLLVAQAQAP